MIILELRLKYNMNMFYAQKYSLSALKFHKQKLQSSIRVKRTDRCGLDYCSVFILDPQNASERSHCLLWIIGHGAPQSH